MDKLKNRKLDNTFVFKSFSELLSEVHISNLRKDDRFMPSAEDSVSSHFGESLNKWRDLNCTQHFADFLKEMKEEVGSLILVIHNQELIVSCLERHLQIENSLALEPLVDLTVHLSRDLQKDFYEKHFVKFFEIFIQLLNKHHQNVDLLKSIFTALSFIFKFLQKKFLADFGKIFHLFCPLLNPHKYKYYINKFAAEAFSFLMRKHKNLNFVLKYVIKSVIENADLTTGVSQLLFEMVRGIKLQFFSQTPQILSTLLDIIGEEEFSVKESEKLLLELWMLMCTHTTKSHSSVIIVTPLQILGRIYDNHLASGKGNLKQIEMIMSLMLQLVQYKKCSLFQSVAPVVEQLEKMLAGPVLSDEYEVLAFDIASNILMSDIEFLPVHVRPTLMKLVFDKKFRFESILRFTRNILKISHFEKDALTYFMKYCKEIFTSSPDKVLHALMLVVLKRPDSACNEKFRLISEFENYAVSYLEKILNEDEFACLELQKMWAVFSCYPYACNSANEKFINGTKLLVKKLNSSAKNSSSSSSLLRKKLLSVLKQVVRTLIHISNLDKHLDQCITEDFLTGLLKDFREDEESLKIVLLCIENIPSIKNNLSDELFVKWFAAVEENLSSPYSQIRLLTLELLCHFNLPLVPPPEDSDLKIEGNLFHICIEAERIKPTIQTYKTKLNLLQNLSHEHITYRLPTVCSEQVPLRYLISQLFVNFQPLWKPVQELIAMYANNLKLDDFWGVYGQQLQVAAAEALSSNKEKENDSEENDGKESEGPLPAKVLMSSLFKKDYQSSIEARKLDRPDFLCYRQHLWTCMQLFPLKCEARWRIVVPIFFKFLEEEYKYDWDNVMYRRKENIFEEDDVMSTKRRRAPEKFLVFHLQLLSMFTQPRNIAQGQKLFDLYMELLKVSSVDVQKLAFACLMTYKLPYLMPYREKMEKLLDEKTFKDEMILSTFVGEQCTIEAKHRSDVIPVLMRILLGKMKLRMGKEANGRTLGQTRKNLVLTFLASFEGDEIAVLLDLLFSPILHLTKNDVLDNIENILSGKLEIGLPLKKLQSTITNVELIFKKLGNRTDYVPKLFNMILCLGAFCNHLLGDKRETLRSEVITKVKGLRISILGLVVKFFELFRSFSYRTEDVDALFKAVVWPQLNNLHQVALNNPSGLLKLIVTWSENSRYHCLMAKCHPEDLNLAPFPAALNILKATTINPTTLGQVLQLVENLMNINEKDDYDEDEVKPDPIEPGNVMEVPAITDVPDVSYGTRIVVSSCSVILLYIERLLIKLPSNSSKKKFNAPSKELSILSRLGQFVTKNEFCERIAQQLLLMMSKNVCRVNADTELKIFESIRYLVAHIPKVAYFVKPLALLFGFISNLPSRSQLCFILQEISKKTTSLEKMSIIVTRLNSTEGKLLNEPDYITRAEAFLEASLYVKEKYERKESGDEDVIMLLNNCIFFLITSKDRGLREMSLTCIQELIVVNSKDKFGHAFLRQHVIPLVKKHLRIHAEDNRHCVIKLLHTLVNHLGDQASFKCLLELCDTEDEEKDFFLNVIHFQMHRRTRALRKLAIFLKEYQGEKNKMLQDTLKLYILPIVLNFIKDDSYTKHTDLLDAAVEAVSAIFSYLSWDAYFSSLKSFLKVLEKSPPNQKLIVRIIVAILDGFHFDLKHSRFDCKTSKADEKKIETFEKDEEMDVENEDEEEEGNAMDVDVTDKNSSTLSSTNSAVNLATNKADFWIECNASTATQIHKLMMNFIFPILQQSLTHKSKSDEQHKLAEPGKFAEDEEILRVSIALAMIKLLQKLPPGSLERNLQGIVLKLCFFLGSRAKDIRDVARDTIKKAIFFLGPKYFNNFLVEMKSHLHRGYQLHVLCYSVWYLLEEMSKKLNEEQTPFMKEGDIDRCIPLLNEIFHKELFDEVADEKEVDAISRKLFEAKTTKSFDSYRLVAAWISIECLPKIVLPLKEVLDTTHSHKVIKKIVEALNRISHGVLDNKTLSINFTLSFIYGLTSDSIQSLLSNELGEFKAEKRESWMRPESCLIIPTAPPRTGVKTKSDVKTNLHILAEFGFNLLYLLLKNSHFHSKDQSHLEMLDPFIKILADSIDSKHAKISTASLQCLASLLRFPLPSLVKNVKRIVNKSFIVLRSLGVSNAEHSDVLKWCFKVIEVVVQFVSYHNITEEQLRVLLSYVEQDLYNYTKHATAFPLLHAILCRKLSSTELCDIMEKVREMSVKSESEEVRKKCRKVFMTYLLDYPIQPKTMEGHITFFISQLEYEYESGRVSAFEMINTIIKVFPKNILTSYSMVIFLQLAQSRLNDDSTKCVMHASTNIKLLLQKIENEDKDKIIKLVISWMKEKKTTVQMLFAMVMSLFAESEQENFKRNLQVVLPALTKLIDPCKFNEAISSDKDQLDKDRLLYYYLDLLLNVFKHCNILKDPNFVSLLLPIWGHIEVHCKYEYEPVRIKTAQLYGILFSKWTPEELVRSSMSENYSAPPPSKKSKKNRPANKEEEIKFYPQIDFKSKLYTLLGTFCFQLSTEISLELANEVLKNLLYMSEVMLYLPEEDVEREANDKTTVSIKWLLKRVCKEISTEVVYYKHSTVKRNSIFVWLGSVVALLGRFKRVSEHLEIIMRPLVREELDQSPDADASLKQIVIEILNLIKLTVGDGEYNKLYCQITASISSKKISAKEVKAQQAASMPDVFAKRKIKRNVAKSEAKKRKKQDLKPYRNSKKRKVEP